jgi:esterase
MLLYSRSYGSGNPFIILHGLLGSSDNWQTLGKQLGKSYHVIIPDARNHGRSPHSDEFNYVVMTDDVRDCMDQQRLFSTHLLGHSMGGKTAMLFALTYPERVDKLIVVDIAPRRYGNEHERIFHALTSIDLAAMTSRTVIDETLATEIPEFALRQFLMKNLRRDEAGSFQWKMNLKVLERTYNEIAVDIQGTRQFEKPTLFIKGSLSNAITHDDEPLMKKLFPNMKIATLQGVGHWIHAEAPEKFAQYVLEFLSK